MWSDLEYLYKLFLEYFDIAKHTDKGHLHGTTAQEYTKYDFNRLGFS